MPPKRQQNRTILSRRLTGASVKSKRKEKTHDDERVKPKSKRVRDMKPAPILKQSSMRTGLRKLTAQRDKFAMTSVKRRHLDQIIDDVGSGRVCGNGQTLSDSVELSDDPTNTGTPVQIRGVSRSASLILPRNGNSGNVMALPRTIASVEVHALDNRGPQNESSQSENVLNSNEVGQGSMSTLTTSNRQSNVTEPNQMNGPVQDGMVQGQRSTITVDDLDIALKALTGKSFSEITSLNLPPFNIATGSSRDERGASITVPGITGSVGVPDTTEQLGAGQSSQRDAGQSVGAVINLAATNQDSERIRPPITQRSSSMATVPIENAVSNDGDNQPNLSDVMGRALQVHDSMLSQLKRSETLIRELQGRAENEVSGVSGGQAASDPGSSSLRNLVAQPSLGQDVVNLTRVGISMGTDQTSQGSMIHPAPQDKGEGSADARVNGPSIDGRGRKRQRDQTPEPRRQRGSQSSPSESAVSRRSHQGCSIGHARTRSIKGSSSHSSDLTSESSNDESDDNSDDSTDDDLKSVDSSFQPGVRTPRASRFLPTFTGEGEKWKVWFARFEDVAAAHRWTTAERLSALIPLLRKKAGEFVFGSVSRKVRSNYDKLVRELRMRYRTVESKRGYKLKWTELKQTPSQTVEELAAHIKFLHDKAFPNRDQKTRREDMVSKFFEALTDTGAKAQVQFVKNPKNIDDAVKYVVHYSDTYKSKKSDGKARATKTETDSDGEEQDGVVVRAATSQPPVKKTKTDSSKPSQTSSKESNTKQQNGFKGSRGNNNKDPKSNKCFKCDGIGHMKRVCPTDRNKFSGQCFTCNGIGHKALVCPSNPQQQSPQLVSNPPSSGNQPQVSTQPVPLMGMQMTGASLPMTVQPSLAQPYTLSVQPSYPAVLASGSQQMQQPGPVAVSGVANDGTRLGNTSTMVQQGQAGGQPGGGGLTASSGSTGGVGPQPQVTN